MSSEKIGDNPPKDEAGEPQTALVEHKPNESAAVLVERGGLQSLDDITLAEGANLNLLEQALLEVGGSIADVKKMKKRLFYELAQKLAGEKREFEFQLKGDETFERLLNAGKGEYDPRITAKNFPLDPRPAEHGKIMLLRSDVRLKEIPEDDRPFNPNFDWMRKGREQNSLQPVSMQHQLLFRALFPGILEIKFKEDIANIDCGWKSPEDGEIYYPVFSRGKMELKTQKELQRYFHQNLLYLGLQTEKRE